MSAAVLELEGLTTGYEDAAVVRELDLSVGEGEVVALLDQGPARARVSAWWTRVARLVTARLADDLTALVLKRTASI